MTYQLRAFIALDASFGRPRAARGSLLAPHPQATHTHTHTQTHLQFDRQLPLRSLARTYRRARLALSDATYGTSPWFPCVRQGRLMHEMQPRALEVGAQLAGPRRRSSTTLVPRVLLRLIHSESRTGSGMPPPQLQQASHHRPWLRASRRQPNLSVSR